MLLTTPVILTVERIDIPSIKHCTVSVGRALPKRFILTIMHEQDMVVGIEITDYVILY